MRSLRVRLLVWLCLALCTLWGGVATWMFTGMRHELRSVLDDRLIASARMVAGIVHQFKPQNASPGRCCINAAEVEFPLTPDAATPQ